MKNIPKMFLRVSTSKICSESAVEDSVQSWIGIQVRHTDKNRNQRPYLENIFHEKDYNDLPHNESNQRKKRSFY